jgi:hypothetical protein
MHGGSPQVEQKVQENGIPDGAAVFTNIAKEKT